MRQWVMVLHLAELMFFEDHLTVWGVDIVNKEWRRFAQHRQSFILKHILSHTSHFWYDLIESADCNSIPKPQKLAKISICTDAYNIVNYIYIYTHMHFYLVILFELMSPSTSSSARSQKRVKGPSWDNSWRRRLQPEFRNSPVNMWISKCKIGKIVRGEANKSIRNHPRLQCLGWSRRPRGVDNFDPYPTVAVYHLFKPAKLKVTYVLDCFGEGHTMWFI